jgi:hypothetical protein
MVMPLFERGGLHPDFGRGLHPDTAVTLMEAW